MVKCVSGLFSQVLRWAVSSDKPKLLAQQGIVEYEYNTISTNILKKHEFPNNLSMGRELAYAINLNCYVHDIFGVTFVFQKDWNISIQGNNVTLSHKMGISTGIGC